MRETHSCAFLATLPDFCSFQSHKAFCLCPNTPFNPLTNLERSLAGIPLFYFKHGDKCIPISPVRDIVKRFSSGAPPTVGIEIGAGYDRTREVVMLVVESGDESALCAPERVLAGWNMEREASVVAGDDGLHALPILRTDDGDAGTRERATALRIHDRPGDAVRAGRNLRPLRVLRLRLRGTEEHQTRHGEYGQAPASLD